MPGKYGYGNESKKGSTSTTSFKKEYQPQYFAGSKVAKNAPNIGHTTPPHETNIINRKYGKARGRQIMPAAFDRCVKKVKAKGTGNPYAICRASMGTDKQIKARSKSKGKKK